MTFICDELVQAISERHSRDLAAHMGAIPNDSILVMDSSVWTSFVRNRMLKGDEFHGLNLAEIWMLEREHLRDLFVQTYENKEFPAFTASNRNEFKAGYQKLVRRASDPYEALCYRWNLDKIPSLKGLDEEHFDERASADVAFSQFMESMQAYQGLFQMYQSRTYHLPRSIRSQKPAMQLAMRSLIIPKKGGSPHHKCHDADMLAEAYALSFEKPVTVFSRDNDVPSMHAGWYRQEERLAKQFGFEKSPGNLTIVLDDANDKPYIQSSSKIR